MEKHLTKINNKTIRFLMVGLLAFLVIGVNQVQAATDKTNEEANNKKCVKETNELVGTWQGYKKGGSEGYTWKIDNQTVVENSKKEGIKKYWYRKMTDNGLYSLEGEGEDISLSIKVNNNILTVSDGSETFKFKRQGLSPGAKYLQCRMMGKWGSLKNLIITKDKIKWYNESGKFLEEESYRFIDEKTIETTKSNGKKHTYTVYFSKPRTDMEILTLSGFHPVYKRVNSIFTRNK